MRSIRHTATRYGPGAFVALAYPLLAILTLAGLALFLVRLGPEWLTETDGLNAVQRDEARGRVRTALFAFAAGVIALVGAVYTARTFELNRRGQITERFTRAIEQLGSDKLEIRLGGIYALERIAHESVDERGPVIEVLTAYIRENSPWPPPSANVTDDLGLVLPEPPPTVDIAAIMTVLARRRVTPKQEPHQIDLSDTNLIGLDARGIDLRFAQLVGARLQRANLDEAKLEAANLEDADLTGATLLDANLRHASLNQAQLKGVHAYHANLDGADLQGANLQHTNFLNARLTRTNLEGATLLGASLNGTDFTDAVCDPATAWPDDYSWRDAGVHMVNHDTETQ